MAGKLVLLLALACVLAANAAPSTPFQQWLANKSSASAKVQSDYEEVEKLKTCLAEVAYRNCEPLQHNADDSAVVRGYTEAKVACCKSLDGDKYSSAVHDLFAEAEHVGLCTYVEEYFPTAIDYDGKEVTKIGHFKAECDLGEKSGKCGEPYCEGMLLKASGDILRYEHVAFMHGLSEASTEDGSKCPLDYITPAAPTKAQLQASTEEYPAKGDDDEPVFMHGQGDIFCGVFHIVSRHHKTPYKTGTFQRVVSTGETAKYVKSSEPSKKSYVAKDGHIALEFFKGGAYY